MPLASATTKFGFRIRTRQGMVVDNLMIHGRDEADAERKVRQMYLHCEILECNAVRSSRTFSASSFEDVISLISK
jgi:hypothetical protein